MSDARGEREIVEDGVSTLADVLVLAHLNDLELLGSHQAISDLLALSLIQLTVSQVDLRDALEVREYATDGLSILERDGLVIDLEDLQLRQALQAGVQVLVTGRAKDVVDLKLDKLTTVVLEVLETLLHVLEAVGTQVDEGVLVYLQDLHILQPADQGHQIVVVRLELLLLQDAEAESVNEGPDHIDIVIEQLEVLVLREVLEHLLEAELQEEVSPSEVLRVVLIDSVLSNQSHEVASIVLLGDVLSQVILLVLDVGEVSHLDFVIIVGLSKEFGGWLLTSGRVLTQGSDPRELLKDGFLPLGVLSWEPLFLFLFVELEDLDLLIEEGLGLNVQLGDHVHVFIITVIALSAGVLDGLLEAVSEGLSIRAWNTHKRIVLVKALDLLDLEACLLELILFLWWKAAVEIVK